MLIYHEVVAVPTVTPSSVALRCIILIYHTDTSDWACLEGERLPGTSTINTQSFGTITPWTSTGGNQLLPKCLTDNQLNVQSSALDKNNVAALCWDARGPWQFDIITNTMTHFHYLAFVHFFLNSLLNKPLSPTCTHTIKHNNIKLPCVTFVKYYKGSSTLHTPAV